MVIRIFLFCTALLYFSCTAKQPKGSAAFESHPLAKNVSDVTNIQTRENSVPNFSWTDSSGKQVTFDSFKGKITIVNFWATWCVPCKKEIPDLIELSKELAGNNVRIIGISKDEGPNALNDLKSFVAEAKIPYQIVLSNEDLEQGFGNIGGIPTTFLVNEEGKIVQTLFGIRSKDSFKQAILALLK